ncbi:HAMP domain-containing histidine kinase, partial [bacterium]
MTLYQMLGEHRSEILELCRVKMAAALELPEGQPLHQGLIHLYDELVEVIGRSIDDGSESARQEFVAEFVAVEVSRRHAQEAQRLGYTVDQFVRGHGSLCQGITEYAHTSGTTITTAEYAQLNLCLDVAIAQAVTEFQSLSRRSSESEERQRIGSLVHELRNHLTSAVLAHEMIRMGGVAASGATSAVLANALRHMREIIDRSIAEVRLNAATDLAPTVFSLLDLLSEVEGSLSAEANAKRVHLEVEVDPALRVRGDEHLMVSAVTNLVQNGIKFTPAGGNVWLRTFAEGTDAVIEIEDQCGGLPEGRAEALFAPFVQEGGDRSGLGL